ncbi:phosphoribosylaminoimidazolesuccinocarboxamide synthase, partial [Jatrophihabitans endophyticus]|uniref:phosphoribosylaminoimidazolesuccinocarboxamide synthase n=1 Tax=Jatrophihabitans endophyticus TaxID=1206085 RepID=UPI0019E85645
MAIPAPPGPSGDAPPGLVHVHSGKVRDLYRAADAEGDDRLIMVASDRISAFDFVL